MRRSRLPLMRVVGLLAVLAIVLAACGDDDNDSKAESGGTTGGSSASKTYALAFVGPLTGPNANLGVNIRDGAKVAVDEANKAGGDVKFTLKPFDTQGDPAQAPTVKDKYINDDSVLGVVGPTFSGETKAVLQAYDDAGLVMVSASATNVDLPTIVSGGKVFHRLVPDDDVQAKGVSDYVTKKLQAKNVFYVDDNSDYGKGLAGGTQTTLEAAGVKTAGHDAIDPKSQDFSAVVNKVKAASPKPDIVFYGGYYAEAGRLAKQLKDGGVSGVFMSGDGTLDAAFITSAGSNGAEGAQITCACKLATSDAPGGLGTFAKSYKSLNGKDPGTYSTEGYDAAKILIQGITKGSTTRDKLRDYVNGLGTYNGLSKEIAFESNGNIKAGDVFVYEVKSGKLTVLGTTDELAK
jgi:branched-chain amino acid transport system substrate-binding protein